MINIHDINGLVFWTERELRFREYVQQTLCDVIKATLWEENPAWEFVRTEGSVLIPRTIINSEYTEENVFIQSRLDEHEHELVLRPETTPSSYAFARTFLDAPNSYKPPLCVWQSGKSFRREQDQPTKFMRLKEFHQLEFQCIYTDDTLNDYQGPVLEGLRKELELLMGGRICRMIESDRIPKYAETTTDIEVWDETTDRWMELCSSSIRKDFPGTFTFNTKKGPVEKGLKVLEFALGLDRIVFQRFAMIE